MAGRITPERIKSVLSSFLIKAEKSPNVLGLDVISRPKGSQEKHKSTTEDDLTPKSNTAALRSYKSFLKRLDTFSAITWFGKPSELSPLMCARYGWENVETDMLQCAGCKAFLCGKLPMIIDTEAYKQSLEKLKKNIVSSHDRLCVFGSFPCPEDFCQVQVDDVASLLVSFTERLTSLCEIQDQLPNLDIACMEQLGYDEGQAGAYCKRHLMPEMNVSPQAVTLTITGWTCSPSNKEILICSMCRRKIGLWNYSCGAKPVSDGEASSDGDGDLPDEPPVKRKKVSASAKPRKESLNPVGEHHHWCPWVQLHQPASKPSSNTSSLSSPPSRPVPLASSPSSALSVTPKRGGGGGGQLESEAAAGRAGANVAAAASTPIYIAALKSIAPGLMDNNTGLATGMKRSPMPEGIRCFRRAMNTWSSPKSVSPSTSPQKQSQQPGSSEPTS